MRLDDLGDLLREFEARLVALGVSGEAARRAVQDAEVVAVMDLAETQADRRFLDLFGAIGSSGLAERQGVSTRTICTRRQAAADRLYRKNIGSNPSGPSSEEAA